MNRTRRFGDERAKKLRIQLPAGTKRMIWKCRGSPVIADVDVCVMDGWKVVIFVKQKEG